MLVLPAFHPVVFSNVTLVKLKHKLNALSTILVTLLGIVMLVRLEQPLNA